MEADFLVYFLLANVSRSCSLLRRTEFDDYICQGFDCLILGKCGPVRLFATLVSFSVSMFGSWNLLRVKTRRHSNAST